MRTVWVLKVFFYLVIFWAVQWKNHSICNLNDTVQSNYQARHVSLSLALRLSSFSLGRGWSSRPFPASWSSGKKTFFGPITCHSWQDIGKKTAISSWNFDLFLTFFMDCGHIYFPKGHIWGSTSRPHIGDMMMSLFFTLGSTVHDWGWPKNGPFWTKKGQTWQACQHSKLVQRGPKGTKMVNLSVFYHLRPFWVHGAWRQFLLDKNKQRFCFSQGFGFDVRVPKM